MEGHYQVVPVNAKTEYTPDEMMMALKNMTIDDFVLSIMHDTTGKYDGIFKKKVEVQEYGLHS